MITVHDSESHRLKLPTSVKAVRRPSPVRRRAYPCQRQRHGSPLWAVLPSTRSSRLGHVSTQTMTPLFGAIAVVIRTIAYLATMALAAQIVYSKVGLRILRTAWFNLAVGWRVGRDRRGRAVHVTASLRHVAGAWPTSFLNARLNAASDS